MCRCNKELCCHLFAVVVAVVSELARGGTQCESLYADDLVLMSETFEGQRNKFLKWKEAFSTAWV